MDERQPISDSRFPGSVDPGHADPVAWVQDRARRLLLAASGSHDWDHTRRVAALCEHIGRVEKADLRVLRMAAYLHDIGMQNEQFAGGDPEAIRAAHHEQTAEMIYRVWEDPANAVNLALGDDPALVLSKARNGFGELELDPALPQRRVEGCGHFRVKRRHDLRQPLDQVKAAIHALGRLPSSELLSVSPLYRSAPMGPAGQPDYINAVVALVTTLYPELVPVPDRQSDVS